MKICFCIPSCQSLKYLEQVQRNTWITELEVEHKFFLGNSSVVEKEDEVKLLVHDSIDTLTSKVLSICTWAMEHGYDYIFKCDLDTLVKPKELLLTDWDKHDYTGGQNGFFASGGAGYWLSKKAMEAVVEKEVNWGREEDVFVAQAVLGNGMILHPDSRYKFYPGDILDSSTLTYHLSSVKGWSGKYEPSSMDEAWDSVKAGRSYFPSTWYSRPLRFRRSK